MRKKSLALMFSMLLVVSVVTACGTERKSESTPTAEPTRTAVTTLVSTPDESTSVPVPTVSAVAATPETAVQMQPTQPDVVAVSAATPVSDLATDVALTPLSGALVFEGREHQDYVITENGCAGLGEWRMLKPGAQVVVRDANGTVVDVSQLESISTDSGCEWVFDIDAPANGFFSVTIPMVTEVWFHADDAEVQSGNIELIVP